MKGFHIGHSSQGGYSKDTYISKIGIIALILAPIVIAGLIANIYANVRNSQGSFTFQYLLDLISSYQSVAPNFAFNQFTISGSWGVFDFLRVTIEFFGNAFSLIGFLAINLVELLRFILHFAVGIFSI